MEKKTVSLTNGAGRSGQHHAEYSTMHHFLTPFMKINSKCMKNLNVRQETIKIVVEKAGKNLSDLSCSNFLLDSSPKARELKAKMNYWDP